MVADIPRARNSIVLEVDSLTVQVAHIPLIVHQAVDSLIVRVDLLELVLQRLPAHKETWSLLVWKLAHQTEAQRAARAVVKASSTVAAEL